MNDKMKTYCDGAAMAYRDCGQKIADIIESSPPEIREFMDELRPLSQAMLEKANEVYKEVERFESAFQ